MGKEERERVGREGGRERAESREKRAESREQEEEEEEEEVQVRAEINEQQCKQYSFTDVSINCNKNISIYELLSIKEFHRWCTGLAH